MGKWQTIRKKSREYHAEILLFWLVLLILSDILETMAWNDVYGLYYYYLDYVARCFKFVANIALILWSGTLLQKTLAFWERREIKKAAEIPGVSAESSPEPSNTAASPVNLFPVLQYILDAVVLFALSWTVIDFIRMTFNSYPPNIYIDYFFGEFQIFSYRMLLLPAAVCIGAGALLYYLGGKKNSAVILLEAVFLLSFTLCVTALLCLLTGIDISGVTIWTLLLINALFAVNILFGPIRQFVRRGHTSPCELEPLLSLPARKKKKKEHKKRSAATGKLSGISMKSLWTLRFTLRMLPYMALFAGLVFLLSSCLYTIQPYQQALVYHFGRLSGECVTDPGLHCKLPAPFETVEIVDVSRVQSLFIGYEPSGSSDYLWTSTHGGNEYALLLGDGNELVAVNMRLNYYIDDLVDYRTNYEDPEALLSARAYAVMMERTMSSDLDTVLSVDRQSLSSEVGEELNAYSDEMGLGIYVGNVIIESIHPSVEVASVYQNVVNATIKQNTLLSNAEAYAEETLNAAEKESAVSVNAAQAAQITGVTQAKSDAMAFAAACEAYALSPVCYLQIKTANVFKQVIQNAKLYVFTPETQDEMRRFLILNGQNVVTIGSEYE